MGQKIPGQMIDPATSSFTADVHAALYQSLLQNPTLGFWVVDENGRFLQVNDTYLHRSGYTRQELIGQPIHHVEAQETVEETASHLQNIMAQGQLLFTSLHRAQNGERWPVEISASYADGHIFAIIQDITHRKKTESELHQKSTALENSINGFDIISAEGTFLYANRAYLAMWGYDSLDEIIGTSPVGHCADPQVPMQIIQNLEAHGAYSLVFTAKRKDGTTFEVMMVAQKMVDETGTVTYTGTSLDITALLQARHHLRTERTHLRNLLDTIPDLVWLKDPNGVYLACNPAFEKLVGVSEADLIGKTDYDFFKPSTADFFRNHDKKAMQAGKPRINEEWLTFAANGRTILAETIKTPIRDEEEQILGVLGIARDITERKEAEQALRESEERLELALRGADLGLWDWDVTTDHVVYNNRWAEMLGYTLTELELFGDIWEELVHPDDKLKDTDLFQAHLNGRTPFYESVYRLRSKDGSWRWILDRGRVLQRDEAGKPLRVVGTHLDITERKLAEDALQESEERLQLFIDHAPAALAMFDHDMHYLAVSQRWLADYGLENQSILGRSHYKIFPEIPDWWKAIHQRGLAGEVIRTEEDPFERLDGHTQWLRWEVRPWYTPHDEVGGIVVFSEDITKRKEAETAVQQMQAVLAEAEAVAQSGSWKYDILTQKSTWSDGIYDIFGIDRQTFTGNAYEAIQMRVHPDDLEKANQAAIDTFVHHQPNALESRLRLPDGSKRVIWMESRVQVAENGRPTAMIGYIQDITERKQAEEKIEELQQILSQAETIAKIGSWKWDFTTHALTWSAEMYHLFGVDPANSELDLSQVIQVRIHPDDRATVEQSNASVMAAHKPKPLEYRLVLPNGTQRVVWAEGRLVRNEAGQPTALVGYAQDITERKRAEQAIRDSEERYHSTLENMLEGCQIIGFDWRYLYANESVARHGRTKVNHLLGKTMMEAYPGIENTELFTVLTHCMTKRTAHFMENKFEYEDGSYAWFDLSIQPVPEGLFILSIDITERKEAVEGLRQSEERFSKAFHLSPAALCLTRGNGTILDINESFERISGYSREELLDQDATNLNIFTQEQRADLRQKMTTDGNRLREAEMTIRTKSGEMRHVLYSVEIVDIKDEPCALTLAFDITERKQMEETIAQLNQRMELILNSAGEGIYGADVNGRITFINPTMAHMLGWQPKELRGQSAHSLFHHSYPDGTPYPAEDCEIWTAVLHGQELHNKPDVFWHKDGHPVFIEYTTTPIYQSGLAVGSVTIVRDVSQSKKAAEEQAILEEQLRQAQKMESIGRLAGGVAHDFNNQLAVIKLYGDLMRHTMNQHDPLLPKLEQIRQAVDRSADLTRQLLAFSRKQVLQPVLLNINNLVTNLEKMLGRLIGEDIILSSSLQPDLWPVMADPGQMEQVIMNLVINARDAMPTGGMITLETRNVYPPDRTIHLHQDMPDGPCVLLAITDTGYGMEETTRKQIFEPFFTTKQPGQGTGLGLATVHGIVKQSGGSIYVYSEPGKGATFKIYLPAEQHTQAKQTAEEAGETPLLGNETILLVEDEPMLRELVQETLTEIGYTVFAAANGEAGLAIAQAEPINLLLTDVVLPQMSGREIAAALTAVSPQTKVLYISGYMDDAVIRHGVLTSEVNFLSKRSRAAPGPPKCAKC
ncbi:MAG: PAS domain S-box protein [Chloroflexota bacterium]